MNMTNQVRFVSSLSAAFLKYEAFHYLCSQKK